MRTVDCFVVALYLVLVFAIGLRARGGRNQVDDYFSAHGAFKGRLGAFLIGLSIAASFFSGISFIVYSSFAYGSGLQIMGGVIALPLAGLGLRYWFLDRYLVAGVRRPYDIVEARFGYGVRSCLSVMFVLLRVGWMAVIIYAPTLIIMGALGLGPHWFWPIVVVIGTVCTLISSLGGIRGVIVTDAVQFMIMALGLVVIIISILSRLHLPMGTVLANLKSSHHLQLVDFSFSFTQPWTLWAILLGGLVNSFGLYMSDQMSLQRYLASESRQSLFRSIAINVCGAIGVILLLMAVGLLLFVWYLHHPDPGLPVSSDQVLPYFATHELPPGMSGLLVAAILAATMNTLTSGINSLAGSVTNDFVSRLGRLRTSAELFRIGRITSVGIGVISTLAAGFASHLGTVLQASNIVMGAFLGPMLACMALAVSSLPVRSGAVFWGMIAGAITGSAVTFTPASSFWVGPAGCLVALGIPWLDMLLGGRPVAPTVPAEASPAQSL